MPKRILILCNALEVGGAERSLGLLAVGLRERDFDPVVVTLRAKGRFFADIRAAGVPAVFVDMRSRWDLRGAVRVYRLGRLAPEVVVTHSIDADVLGRLVARRLRVPHVAIEQGGVGIHRTLHRRLLTRLVAPGVDRVVAVSNTQLPDLERLGYPRERIVVIPNGVTSDVRAGARDQLRRDLGFGPDEVVVALVAGLRPEKRPDLFVDAVGRARRIDPRIRGVVVGDGLLRDELEQRIRESATRIQLLGERSDVPELMLAADAVCLSSDVEGLPLVVVEAMSMGRPVIATDVGGLSEAVETGVTGWLVPRRDADAYAAALLEFAADSGRARRMGEEGRSRYRRLFTAEAMNDRYADLLEELTGRALAARRGR